jgi:N-acetyl-gamma-glutamyl-phosphate reductase
VPGCHASGFIALIYPLIEAGAISPDALITCHSITGYSGGGKKMIAEYESEERDSLLDAPRQYAITQSHKHLKEMKAITGLNSAPVFCPIVSDFYSGMTVTVPMFASQLNDGFGIENLKEIYKNKYKDSLVKYEESIDDNGFVSAHKLSHKDSMAIAVAGNEERILLIATYDNLGKGASGAAVECMNIVLDTDRSKGLEI